MGSNEWLKQLKPDDKIYVDESRYGNHDYRLTTVARVTPTGRVKVWDRRHENMLEFSPEGWRREGSGRWDRHSDYLVQYTDELYQKEQNLAEFNNTVAVLGAMKWRNLTLDQLRRIKAIIGETDSDTREG